MNGVLEGWFGRKEDILRSIQIMLYMTMIGIWLYTVWWLVYAAVMSERNRIAGEELAANMAG